MSDDREKLLAEVSQTTQPPAKGSNVPAKKAKAEVARADKPGGRFAFAIITAVVFGAIAFIVGWLFTPFVLSGTSMGLGAALGSFATALLAGPPRWFSS
jgi:fatty acid desaturase